MYELTEENAKQLDKEIEKIIDRELSNIIDSLALNNDDFKIPSGFFNWYKDIILHDIFHVMYSHALREIDFYPDYSDDL